MKNVFILLSMFCLASAKGANYYFSASSGDDTRTTLQASNPSTPWRSLSKLNTFFSSLQAGDSVLFKRGDTFYGSITVNKAGTASLPIVLGAYGIGSKPVISAMQAITSWTSLGNGIYESTSTVSSLTSLNMVT